MGAPASDRLTAPTTRAYALAVAPVAILGLPLGVLLPPYIAQGGVISVGLVGIIFTIGTIWDGIVDPLIGNLIDRKSAAAAPHLRWMLMASPLVLATLAILVFLGDTLPFLWLLLALVLFTSSLSLFDVAHLAWGSALAGDKGESSRLFGAREWAGKVFVLAAFAAPAILQLQQPGLKLDGQLLAYAGLAAITLPFALWFASRLPVRPIISQPNSSLRAELKNLLNFRPLKLLVLAQALNTFGLGAMTSLFVFYVAAVLDLDSQGPVLLLISFVGGVVMTPAWIAVAVRFGKPKGMLLMSVWLVAVLLTSLLLPEGNFPIAAIFVFALGSGFAGLIFIYGLASDIVPMYREKSGRDRAGLIFSLTNVTQKIGTAIGIGVSYVALDVLGFDARNVSASEDALRYLYFGIPTLGWTAVALVMAALHREIAANTQVPSLEPKTEALTE
jgi:glycoside/pentoside/hexuronide:cation symporter, GPH family